MLETLTAEIEVGHRSRFEPVLEALFAERGAPRLCVPILQPADPYLDTAGEALRRRIFLTRGEGSENLCLRPDFTIPVCLDHVARNGPLPRRTSYCGLVFRQRADGPAEFVQAGIEDLGEVDRAAADGRSLADSLAALDACGIETGELDVVLGDQGLFEAFLRALGLPGGWQRKLVRTFGDEQALRAALDTLAAVEAGQPNGLDDRLAAFARAKDVEALVVAIRAKMEEAGLPPYSGRSSEEVAARLVEKFEIAEARLERGSRELLSRFLAIDCPLNVAVGRLETLAARAELDIGPALDFFRNRNRALQAAGVDLSAIAYRAAFGRPIDYYTGMVFEVRGKGSDEPLVGGGRYDRLPTILGSREPVPAVGFAMWLDRIDSHAATRENAR